MDLSESQQPRRPHRWEEKGGGGEGGQRSKDTKKGGGRSNGEMCCGNEFNSAPEGLRARGPMTGPAGSHMVREERRRKRPSHHCPAGGP